MGTPFMGEIKIISWNFAPAGWAFCNGQFLPINQNQPLFSLLGTMYGGNGQTTFALPDMRGRAPIHFGNEFTEGQAGGQEFHTLTQSEMPAHIHPVNAATANGTVILPTGNYLAGSSPQLFHAPDNNLAAMNAGTLGNTGGSQAHENRQPSFVLNFIIALQGAFPSRN
jgi:microcystin-dependent protein